MTANRHRLYGNRNRIYVYFINLYILIDSADSWYDIACYLK